VRSLLHEVTKGVVLCSKMSHTEPMTKQCCGTCNMGGFTDHNRTPTGRFKKNATAECLYEIPVPTLPSSVRASNRVNGYPKGYVSPDDGTDCPLWAPK
jgi:hypothetical protein